MTREITPQERTRREQFARTLSGAIAASGLRLDEIVARLAAAGSPTSQATLSYWQNGRSRPARGRSLQAVQVLEEILSLETGALTDGLGKGLVTEYSKPSFKASSEQTFEAPVDVEQVLRGWGLALRGMHTQRSVQRSWTVAADRLGHTERTRMICQTEWTRQTALPVVLRDQTADELPRVTALQGCRVGRTLADEASGLVIAELVLPRTFTRGEMFWCEFEVRWSCAEPTPGAATNLGNQTPMFTVDVAFEGTPPPYVVYGTVETTPEGGQVDVEVAKLPVVDAAAGLAVPNATAGLHWLSWA